MMAVEQRIRALRTEQGLSQEDLAEQAEVSRQTVSKWENGVVRPSAEKLARLSEIFGVPADAFLKDDWTPPEETAPTVVEVPVEVRVEVPVEVPVPAPPRYRLWAAVAAVILAAGILIGALLFREAPEDAVPWSEIEGEVIDPSTINGTVPLLPLD